MAKSKYEDAVKARFAEIRQWLEEGLSERQIAANLGVSKSTFETYKRNYPDFLTLLKVGRKKVVREVENALFKRAHGFEYEEIETQIREENGKQIKTIRKTTKYYPPDVRACELVLINKDKEHWVDNPHLIDLRRQLLEWEKEKFRKEQW